MGQIRPRHSLHWLTRFALTGSSGTQTIYSGVESRYNLMINQIYPFPAFRLVVLSLSYRIFYLRLAQECRIFVIVRVWVVGVGEIVVASFFFFFLLSCAQFLYRQIDRPAGSAWRKRLMQDKKVRTR
jgi:hypothetical protein